MAGKPEQLVLMEPPRDEWHIDEHTRELGLRGIEEARRILRERARAHARPARTKPTRMSDRWVS